MGLREGDAGFRRMALAPLPSEPLEAAVSKLPAKGGRPGEPPRGARAGESLLGLVPLGQRFPSLHSSNPGGSEPGELFPVLSNLGFS